MNTADPTPQLRWWARLLQSFFHRGAPTGLLPAPRAQTLENLGDEQENLLEKSQTRQDLRIEFDLLAFSEPTPDDPETLELFLVQYGDVPVATKQWTAPISPDQRFIMLPHSYLTEGRHQLSYHVTLGATGAQDASEVFPFTVDLTAAELGADSGKLVFPADALAGVTARYLETHDDRLEATVPAYFPVRAGDLVTVYWEQQPVGSLPLYERTLSAEEASQPLRLTFTGEQIRSQGDGQRYVTYEVFDRAGNQSRLSRAVALQVDAAPVPRHWPAPAVFDSSAGQVYGMLNPLQALSGVTVKVPANAVFYDAEVARVHWADPAAVGATQVLTPIAGAGPWSARIDKAFIGAHMGKTLEVYYLLNGDDSYAPSMRLALMVGTIPKSSFPTVQSRGATTGAGRLSLRAVPASGDSLTLAPWPLIAARTQLIKLWAQGTGINGVAASHTVLDAVAVTAGQASSGIRDALPLEWLAGLRLNTPLRLFVSVSFDSGQTWIEFPQLSATLVA